LGRVKALPDPDWCRPTAGVGGEQGELERRGAMNWAPVLANTADTVAGVELAAAAP
jgi:hypothetical protein